MNSMNVFVLGGSGFVGRVICNKLDALGHRVTVLTRQRDHARELFLLPRLTVLESDQFDTPTLTRLMAGHDAAIHLIGILNERKRGDFDRIHAELVGEVVGAAEQAGIKRLLHMSALGVHAEAPSQYLRSKAAGEAKVCASRLAWTIFAPSVIFGRGDSFLNRFAKLIDLTPPFAPFLLPGAEAEFQPVWVEDVARAFVAALAHPESIGQRYELVGPKRYRLRELVAYVMQLKQDRHPIIGLPDFATSILANLLQYVPTQPLTPDNVRSMRVANVSDAPFPAFAGQPTALEAIAPEYLSPEALIDPANRLRARARHTQR